jgi:hypothetical protein
MTDSDLNALDSERRAWFEKKQAMIRSCDAWACACALYYVAKIDQNNLCDWPNRVRTNLFMFFLIFVLLFLAFLGQKWIKSSKCTCQISRVLKTGHPAGRTPTHLDSACVRAFHMPTQMDRIRQI